MKRHSMGFFLLTAVLGLCLQVPGALFAQQGGRFQQRTSSAAGGSSYGAGQLGNAVIRYDEATGNLIVITDEETNEHIQKVVDSLDNPIPQVLIKVLFLEVTHTKGLDLGVEGSLKTGRDGANKDVDTISTLFGMAAEAAAGSSGGYYKILDKDLQVTLRALADTSKLEVLSRPSVLTRNNEEATITVGKKIPMITGSRTTNDGQIINTIQWQNVGIILTVTPHITPDSVVEMALSPEISNLSGETVQIQTGVNARVITIRSADTLVAVESGKTVVIGGMMEDNVTETVHKIPLLGDIPVAGALFRHTVNSKVKTELLIFLTPLVVQGSEALRVSSDSEAGRTELAPDAFTGEQMDKFLDQPDVFSKKEVDKSPEKVVKKKGAFKRFWGWMTDWGLQ